jgi:hypothetical protein
MTDLTTILEEPFRIDGSSRQPAVYFRLDVASNDFSASII